MEVRIESNQATAPLAEITRCIQDADPAAVIDQEAGSQALRISTVMGTSELLSALRDGGLFIAASDIQHLPSACCGGCGG